jgi:hypothetical protein
MKISNKEDFIKSILELINLTLNQMDENKEFYQDQERNFFKKFFLKFHYNLQYSLVKKAEYYDLTGIQEYPGLQEKDYPGLLDVVWVSDLEPIVAFEIDHRFRLKSIWKLLNVPAKYKIWITTIKWSKVKLKKFKEIDKENRIDVIDISDSIKYP